MEEGYKVDDVIHSIKSGLSGENEVNVFLNIDSETKIPWNGFCYQIRLNLDILKFSYRKTYTFTHMYHFSSFFITVDIYKSRYRRETCLL